MSSIRIADAKDSYGGSTEAETIMEMAKHRRCDRIYRFANDFGNKRTPSDYAVVAVANSAEDTKYNGSSMVHSLVLVFDRGQLVNEDQLDSNVDSWNPKKPVESPLRGTLGGAEPRRNPAIKPSRDAPLKKTWWQFLK